MNNSVAQITKQSKNFSEWYNDVVLRAELADYSPIRGCMVIRPYGWAIWELMKKELDGRIKKLGVQNAYFPLFIPYSFLEKERRHVEGFSPELAVVTHGGGRKLKAPLVVRPTSETIIYAMYARWIHSWRDLPLLINQWANVVRWEKRTYLFLRTTEFLWQEGHTAHATSKEAKDFTRKAAELYRQFYQEVLAIDPFVGPKSETEKFAGAEITIGIEALVRDKKFIQAATSHFLGQNFAKPFGIRYQDKTGSLRFVWQTCWGLSTRAIGTLIAAHGDDRGLVLPPKVAPIQVVIVPIFSKKLKREQLKEFINKVVAKIKEEKLRVEVDWRDEVTPGWKFNEWELKGVPYRLEIGESEVKEGKITVVSRLGAQRQKRSLGAIKWQREMGRLQEEIYRRYQQFVSTNKQYVDTWEEFEQIIEEKRGAVFAFWCGRQECEKAIKEKTKATTRVLPWESQKGRGRCVFCGRPASYRWLFGRAY